MDEHCCYLAPLPRVPVLFIVGGTVFLLEHSFLSAETEKQETAQDSPLSDILSQYLLTFMLVHVYMLPSRTDRMVPGAAVLLENSYGSCLAFVPFQPSWFTLRNSHFRSSF
eukprot:g13300.t1